MNSMVRVLRYSLIIIIVAGISIAFGYREKLFPEFFVASTSTTTSDTDAAKKKTSSDEPSPAPVSTSAPGPQTPSGSGETAKTTSVKKAITPPVADKVSPSGNTQINTKPVHTQPMPPSESQPASSTEHMTGNSQAVKKPAVPQQPVKVPEANPAATPPKTLPVAKTPVPQPADKTNTQLPQIPQSTRTAIPDRYQAYTGLINQARQFYWQRKYDEAIEMYQKASELMSDNPNTFGEMANIYYSQGQWEKAGEAYYQAAVRLIKAGQLQRVYPMLNLIQGLKPERAKELDAQLKQLSKQ